MSATAGTTTLGRPSITGMIARMPDAAASIANDLVRGRPPSRPGRASSATTTTAARKQPAKIVHGSGSVMKLPMIPGIAHVRTAALMTASAPATHSLKPLSSARSSMKSLPKPEP